MSKRKTAWLLLKDTVNSCMEYRILGLAAEAAFFTLLSVPPLLLSLVGLLGYVDSWTGADTIASVEQNILEASRAVLTDQGVREIAQPILHDVTKGGSPDLISIGFLLALWSGSRAVNVFIDTITVMYGLDGVRGIVKTRLLAFGLFIVALLMGSVVLPLMVIGPDTLVSVVPWGENLIQLLYWPVILVLSVIFLTTLYHVSVPVRSPWIEDTPGALVALGMWVLGSFLLRIYLTNTVEGPTIYGSLAAPVAVLLWIGVSAFAVLVGAAVNAAIDRVWPSVATAAARAANDAAREERAAAVRAERGSPATLTTRTTPTCPPSSPSAGPSSCPRRTSPAACAARPGAAAPRSRSRTATRIPSTAPRPPPLRPAGTGVPPGRRALRRPRPLIPCTRGARPTPARIASVPPGSPARPCGPGRRPPLPYGRCCPTAAWT
ncbi:YihY/virulence factor BrkB family protein [Actinomadura keratinilytica]